MTLRSLFYLSFVGFLTMSCRTSDDAIADPLFGMVTPPTIVAPYKRLLKEIDTNNGVVVREKNYVYSDKKLVAVTTTDNSLNESITYNGELISKIVKTENTSGTSIVTTYNFVYNSANIVTKLEQTRSVNNGTTITNFVGTTDFIYDTNHLIKAVTSYNIVNGNGSFNPALNVTTEWLYQNGNVDNCNITTQDIISNFTGTQTIVYGNYDAKKSAYNGLPFQYNFYTLASEGLSTNNARTVSTGGNTVNYTYTYDDDSPVSRTNGSTVKQFQYTVF